MGGEKGLIDLDREPFSPKSLSSEGFSPCDRASPEETLSGEKQGNSDIKR
jgi:hypothetical protein